MSVIIPKPRPAHWTALFFLGMLAIFFAGAGCKKDTAQEASDSDANGYLCPACALKFYTKRTDFPSTCPKCGKSGVEEVVGYFCKADQHLTLVGRTGGRGGVACEKCGAPLSGMRLPREKDLKEWGATKSSP